MASTRHTKSKTVNVSTKQDKKQKALKNRGNNKKTSSTNMMQIKKAVKMTGFLTFAFTGIGVVWYCIKGKK